MKIEIGFIDDISMPHAKDLGRLASMHFSMIFLVESGILKGWKACKNTDGDFCETSHIMSMVLSSPVMLVLMSMLGLLASCALTLEVTSDTN